MKTTFKGPLTLFLALIIQLSFAQENLISGKVTDNSGLPLPGTTILIKGASTGTSSDFDGNYAIKVNEGEKLVFSFVGYKTQEKTVGKSNTIDIIMVEDSESLDEVIVVAYGSQTKQSIVGSVATISSEIIETQQVTSPLRALQGVVPGVNIVTSGGQPGSNPSIRIRGTASVNLDAEPLIIVDGAPFNGNLNTISQDQIETVSVLKDASASSLYGSRAANGVIIITTKKGKINQAPKVSIRSQIGVSNPTVGIHDLLGPEDYLKQTWTALKNTNQFENGQSAMLATQNATNGLIDHVGYNPYSLANPIDTNGNLVPGAKLLWQSNWEDEVIRNNYLRTNHNLNISGGSDKSTYALSFDYLDEEGPVIPSNFERIASRLNLTSQVKDWFKVGLNTSFSRSTSNDPDQTSESTTQAISWIYNLSSIYPIYVRDANGALILDSSGNRIFDLGNGNGRPTGQSVNNTRPQLGGEHILAALSLGKERRIRSNYLGNAFAEFKLIKGLTFKTNLSYESYLFDSFSFDDDLIGAAANVQGRVSESRDITTTLNAIQSLNYNTSFGLHSLSIDAITEAYTLTQNSLLSQGTGFLPGVENLSAATNPESVGGISETARLNSYLGRVSYDFNKKYYAEFSFRTDGSSRFSENHRWGTFGAAGASWIISNEDFLIDNNLVNYLKLRSSYGEIGNNRTNSFFPYESLFLTGFVNESNPGILLDGISDINLQWEKTLSTNIGLDFELFNGKLAGTIDYYNKESTDLIMEKPLPPSLGVNNILTNIGSIRNYGWEFSLQSTNIKTDKMTWTTGLNFSFDRNKWTKLPEEEIITGSKLWKVGNSIYDFYIQEWAGVDPADGRGMWFTDVLDSNGNVIDKVTTKNYEEATRYELGKSSLPDIQGGFTSFFSYKQFDLNLLFNFSFGAYLLDNDYGGLMNNFSAPGVSAHPDNLKAWQQPGDITDVPMLLANQNDHNSTSSRFLFKNDYVRLKSLTFGYNLPLNTLNRIGLTKFRLFIQADNIWTWQSHKGIEPEQAFNGVTGNRSPLSQTIASGLILEF